jgi:hypothetical protein
MMFRDLVYSKSIFSCAKSAAAALTLLVIVGLPVPAGAQGLETLGNRAAALSAFVAVADDASAVAWNPAGLVYGPIFNILLDFGRSTSAPDEAPPQAGGAAGQLGGTLVSLGVPPLGLSYYRLRATAVVPVSPAVVGSPGREERQVAVRSLVTTNLGATVLQSVGDYVTLGATVRLVRGHVASDGGTIGAWDEGFDRAERLEKRGETTGDVDAGVMVAAGRWRAGAVVRNLTTPAFEVESGDGEAVVARHARAGVAWGNAWPGLSRTIVAVDADLTRVHHPAGERRDLAAGVERWFREQQIGVRGGVRASTVGAARPVVSGGVSYAVRSGTYVEAYVAGGSAGDRGWGVAARLTY